MYVCLLKSRGRSVGHTPSGDQCSALGVGMSVGAGLAYRALIYYSNDLFV